MNTFVGLYLPYIIFGIVCGLVVFINLHRGR